MKRLLLFVASLPTVTILSGCGWTGRGPVLSLPAVTSKAESSEKTANTNEEAEELPPKERSTSAVSPVVKPRQSLDEMFLFQPAKIDKGSSPTVPLPFENVDLTADDGTRFKGWWVAAPKPHAVVLYLHGNGGNLWSLAGMLRWLHEEAGCSVMAVDYRGYGESEGTPTVEGVLKDVRAARIEAAQRGGVPETQIVPMGRSLGGALAIQSAKETPPRGLIIESTFTTLQEVGRVHMGALAGLVPDERLNSVAALTDYTGPLLHSHGDADRVIPFTQGVRLHEVAAGPKQFVRMSGGDHNDAPTKEYLIALRTFLKSLP